MLAVLRAGGAFVPLDPSHPVERLRGLCESVGAKLMLCSRHLVEMLSEVLDTVLPVDDATVAESAQAEEPEGSAMSMPTVSSTNAAYVIFTSGSTGKPKVSKHTGISIYARDSRFVWFCSFF
jgi:non-ribosomal peptide synthetase component F